MTSSNWNPEPGPWPSRDGEAGGAADPYAPRDPYPPQGGASPVGSPAPSDPYGQGVGPGAAPGWASSPGPAPAGGGYGPPVTYALGPPTSGMAVAGFVVSLVSLVLCTGLTSPVGLILSIIGLKQTAPDAQPPAGGRGLAIAGVVISAIGVAFLVLGLVWIFGMAGLSVIMGTSTS